MSNLEMDSLGESYKLLFFLIFLAFWQFPAVERSANSSISSWLFRNDYVTLLEVTENFWRLSRTAKQNFEVTSTESRNHA